MKKNIINIFIFSIIILFAISCNKDLGNYEYKEVNDFNVKVNRKYSIIKKDTVFVIRPEISQTMMKNINNLKFVWTQSKETQKKGDTISTADTLAIKIDTKDPKFIYKHELRLYVTDTITKAMSVYPVTLTIKKPFNGSWLIMHEDEGMTKIGNIEFFADGNNQILKDAYYTNKKKRLSGKPIRMLINRGASDSYYWGYESSCILYLFTTEAEECGIYLPSDGFNMYKSIDKLIYPLEYKYFDINKVTDLFGNTEGCLISNGNVFGNSYASPRMYNIPPETSLSGDSYVTIGDYIGRQYIMYDEKGGRLLTSNLQSYWFGGEEWNVDNDLDSKRPVLSSITTNPKIPNFNPSKLENKKVMYIGNGFAYGVGMIAEWARIAAYVVVIDKENNKMGVADIHTYPLGGVQSNDPDVITAYYEHNIPRDFTENSVIASSVAYNNIIFYASGNKVYKFDFSINGFTPKLVWAHPNQSAIIRKMTMANPYKESSKYENYGHNVNKSLGLVISNSNGNDEFAILNLNNAGSLDDDGLFKSVQQFDDFGKIKDIVFLLED